jgi:hypothetical protein
MVLQADGNDEQATVICHDPGFCFLLMLLTVEEVLCSEIMACISNMMVTAELSCPMADKFSDVFVGPQCGVVELDPSYRGKDPGWMNREFLGYGEGLGNGFDDPPLLF